MNVRRLSLTSAQKQIKSKLEHNINSWNTHNRCFKETLNGNNKDDNIFSHFLFRKYFSAFFDIFLFKVFIHYMFRALYFDSILFVSVPCVRSIFLLHLLTCTWKHFFFSFPSHRQLITGLDISYPRSGRSQVKKKINDKNYWKSATFLICCHKKNDRKFYVRKLFIAPKLMVTKIWPIEKESV